MSLAAAWGNLKPVPRAALTSCSLMALGDVCCQCIQQRRQQQPLRIDVGRTARFSLIGLTLHGPFFCKGFQWLDGRFGTQPTFKNAITKSLVGQVTLFPTYTSLFLIYAELLMGGNMQQALVKVQERFPTLLVTGSVYWPVVNVLNFKLLAPHQRVLGVNMAAVFWNSYLSFVSTAPSHSSSSAKGES